MKDNLAAETDCDIKSRAFKCGHRLKRNKRRCEIFSSIKKTVLVKVISSSSITSSRLYRDPRDIASLADALLARHAIFPLQRTSVGEERLRDEIKERLRGRQPQTMQNWL